ncbi:MAG: serine hydrolase, partial [Bacteroidetes bacterium]|nr:serine hydrolase [Bacteroidota bacterium]
MSKGIYRNLFFSKSIASSALFFILLLASCGEDNSPSTPSNSKADSETEEVVVKREPVPVDSALMEKIKLFFDKHLDNSFFSGTILIAKDDNIYYESCKGLGNYKQKNDSICMMSTFQLASATKPFTSFAILRLISQGKLSLTDTVNQILPDFHFEGITVEMLLSHFSGLPNYMYFTDEHWGYTEGSITNHDVLKLFKEHGVKNGKPNSHFYYNNTNYLVLASIIEQVSHMPYETYMLDSIFLPTGMNNTRIFNNQNRSELVKPTYGHLGDLRPLYYDYLDGVVGDKGMYSNVYDLLKFDQALYECKL